jgi:hypothetical protein
MNEPSSILTIHNKGLQYHLLLPGFTPQKVTTMLWWAVEREGSPLVSDMGRLAMHIIEQACKTPGARLLGGHQVAKMVSPKISSIYSIDRPERSLRLTMDNVIVEDDAAKRIRVYDGAFSDFKKYLHTILANTT